MTVKTRPLSSLLHCHVFTSHHACCCSYCCSSVAFTQHLTMATMEADMLSNRLVVVSCVIMWLCVSAKSHSCWWNPHIMCQTNTVGVCFADFLETWFDWWRCVLEVVRKKRYGNKKCPTPSSCIEWDTFFFVGSLPKQLLKNVRIFVCTRFRALFRPVPGINMSPENLQRFQLFEKLLTGSRKLR